MEPLLKINLKLKKQIAISKRVKKCCKKFKKNNKINAKLRGISPNKIEYMQSYKQLFL